MAKFTVFLDFDAFLYRNVSIHKISFMIKKKKVLNT